MIEPHVDTIQIDVITRYLGEQSNPAENRFAFAYTITIRNLGSVAAQLIDRHWIITDGNGKVQEVRGEGVVGEQPLLRPGASHTYTSGCLLETPVGSMQGSFGMHSEAGDRFRAPVRVFRLAKPNTLH